MNKVEKLALRGVDSKSAFIATNYGSGSESGSGSGSGSGSDFGPGTRCDFFIRDAYFDIEPKYEYVEIDIPLGAGLVYFKFTSLGAGTINVRGESTDYNGSLTIFLKPNEGGTTWILTRSNRDVSIRMYVACYACDPEPEGSGSGSGSGSGY